MNNSILTTLSTIHAAVLSIVAAFMVAFYFYAYEKISNLRTELNDARYQVAQIMSMPPLLGATTLVYHEYFKDGSLDLVKIRDEIFLLSGFAKPTGERHPITKDAGNRLLDILVMLSSTDPYSDRLTWIDPKRDSFEIGAIKRRDYDPKWKDSLIFLNQILILSKPPILSQVAEYAAATKVQNRSSGDDTREKLIQQSWFVDAEQMATGFFQRVDIIQQYAIPRIEDASYKLRFYEDKFQIKRFTTTVLVLTFSLILLGIFLPLFIQLYLKPPAIEVVQVVLLIVTLVPYLVLVLYGLKKVLELNMP